MTCIICGNSNNLVVNKTNDYFYCEQCAIMWSWVLTALIKSMFEAQERKKYEGDKQLCLNFPI